MQGLEIYNDSNTLQISSDFIDMALLDVKIVADQTARSTSEFYAVMGRGSDYISPNEPMGSWSNGAGYVYNFTFDYLDVATKDNLGLELYGSDGKVYYNSNYKSISVLERVAMTVTTADMNTTKIGFSKSYGSKKVAVLLIRDVAHFKYVSQQNITVIETAVFNQDSSGLLTVKTRATAARGGYPPESANYLEFLVIDVTNY